MDEDDILSNVDKLDDILEDAGTGIRAFGNEQGKIMKQFELIRKMQAQLSIKLINNGDGDEAKLADSGEFFELTNKAGNISKMVKQKEKSINELTELLENIADAVDIVEHLEVKSKKK